MILIIIITTIFADRLNLYLYRNFISLFLGREDTTKKSITIHLRIIAATFGNLEKYLVDFKFRRKQITTKYGENWM